MERNLQPNHKLRNKLYCPVVILNELNPDFIALYDLSPAEISRFKEQIAATRSALDQIEARTAVIGRKDDGTTVVSISPFPAEGGQLYDSFNRSIAEILGPERYALYRDISADQFERSTEFDRFGLCQSVLSVNPRSTPSAHGSMNADPATGVMIDTWEGDAHFLKARKPLLYARLIAAGAVQTQ